MKETATMNKAWIPTAYKYQLTQKFEAHITQNGDQWQWAIKSGPQAIHAGVDHTAEEAAESMLNWACFNMSIRLPPEEVEPVAPIPVPVEDVEPEEIASVPTVSTPAPLRMLFAATRNADEGEDDDDDAADDEVEDIGDPDDDLGVCAHGVDVNRECDACAEIADGLDDPGDPDEDSTSAEADADVGPAAGATPVDAFDDDDDLDDLDDDLDDLDTPA